MKENNENFLEFGTRWAINNLDKTSLMRINHMLQESIKNSNFQPRL